MHEMESSNAKRSGASSTNGRNPSAASRTAKVDMQPADKQAVMMTTKKQPWDQDESPIDDQYKMPPQPPISIPISIPVTELTSQNRSFLEMAVRRLRELVTDGQNRRADGRIIIEMPMASGMLTGTIGNSTKWMEKLSR